MNSVEIIEKGFNGFVYLGDLYKLNGGLKTKLGELLMCHNIETGEKKFIPDIVISENDLKIIVK